LKYLVSDDKQTLLTSRLANLMCGINVIGDIISCFCNLRFSTVVAVEIMDFDIKNNIYMSANDDLRTHQVEIVELVEERRWFDILL
jgi:hypothetical protein